MEALCRQLADEDPKRMVVFDSSPLLQTTEAPVLASHMGQIVVIVQAERTSQQRVLSALAKLPPNVPASLVLNQAKGTNDDTYGYGSYYGREYGQEVPRDEA